MVHQRSGAQEIRTYTTCVLPHLPTSTCGIDSFPDLWPPSADSSHDWRTPNFPTVAPSSTNCSSHMAEITYNSPVAAGGDAWTRTMSSCHFSPREQRCRWVWPAKSWRPPIWRRCPCESCTCCVGRWRAMSSCCCYCCDDWISSNRTTTICDHCFECNYGC